jgi:hypothetical protein
MVPKTKDQCLECANLDVKLKNGRKYCELCHDADLYEFDVYTINREQKKKILEFLQTISNKVPVKWDRVIGVEPDAWLLQIYGWIPRFNPNPVFSSLPKEGRKDFLIINLDKTTMAYAGFLTSSVQYSKVIHDLLNQIFNLHLVHYSCVAFKIFSEMDEKGK